MARCSGFSRLGVAVWVTRRHAWHADKSTPGNFPVCDLLCTLAPTAGSRTALRARPAAATGTRSSQPSQLHLLTDLHQGLGRCSAQ
jgi:hypothetical protein